MSSNVFLIHTGFGIAIATALYFAGVARADDDSKLRADLQALARRRVYFGHQSVGVNIMGGLRQLAEEQGVALQVEETRPGVGVPANTFGHGAVPENGDPLLKIASFERAFASGAAAGAEIALLKFCYVDFRPDTDVNFLFANYQAAISRLRTQNPATTENTNHIPTITTPAMRLR